jgi:hypothetical protein
MTTDHRGRIIGNPSTPHGGHNLKPMRRQPRLVAGMSRLYGISNDEASGVLDAYKNQQELGDNAYSGGATPDDERLINKLGTSMPSEVLEETFYNRNMPDGELDRTRPGDEPSEPRPYWNGVPH